MKLILITVIGNRDRCFVKGKFYNRTFRRKIVFSLWLEVLIKTPGNIVSVLWVIAGWWKKRWGWGRRCSKEELWNPTSWICCRVASHYKVPRFKQDTVWSGEITQNKYLKFLKTTLALYHNESKTLSQCENKSISYIITFLPEIWQNTMTACNYLRIPCGFKMFFFFKKVNLHCVIWGTYVKYEEI